MTCPPTVSGRQRCQNRPVSAAPPAFWPPPATRHVVESYDGTRLVAIQAGEGLPIVLTHGALVTSASWARVWAPLVQVGYRLIAFDLRGHGGSDVGGDGFGPAQYGRDLASVLQAFDVRDGAVVGHSTGAIGALALAVEQPHLLSERLCALVLASASPRGIGDTLQNRVLAPLVFSGLIIGALRRPRTGRAFARTLFGERPDAKHVDLAWRLMRATPDTTKLQAPKAVLSFDFGGRLGDLDIPTLLVHGEQDRSVTRQHADALAAELPRAQVSHYAATGHFLVLEQGLRFADDVDAFVRGACVSPAKPTPYPQDPETSLVDDHAYGAPE